MSKPSGITLDPVTFEVLKNSFITTVDQMAEQILRTCYSFVIYNRDFSSALNDANGDSIAEGNMDIAMLDRKLAEGALRPAPVADLDDLPLIAAVLEHGLRSSRSAASPAPEGGRRGHWREIGRREALRGGRWS